MFSAIRKLTGRNDVSNSSSSVHTMAASLQKKFSRGVQYNMKIVIRGDRNVGKTCLFKRLQGQTFVEEYIPTDEIQVASIQWNYKATDDVVKVEVWDIVDKAKKKKKVDGLKLENSSIEYEEPALDAQFLDVYKGTNGVIFLFDITKTWTFDYIKREIDCVPHHIPILILGNLRDMGHHRVTSTDDVHYFIESLSRPPESADVRYTESSMRNGFGLKFLYNFFNLPFLHLQRQTLLRQIDTNTAEIEATMQEMDIYLESEEANYDVFLDALTNRRREAAEAVAPAASVSVPINTIPIPGVQGRILASAKGNNAQKPEMAVEAVSNPNQNSGLEPTKSKVTKNPENVQKPPASSPILATPPSATTSTTTTAKTTTTTLKTESNGSSPVKAPEKAGFMSRLFKGKETPAAKEVEGKEMIPSVASGEEISVDDFVPDGGRLDQSFLNDIPAASSERESSQASKGVSPPTPVEESVSDDEIDCNPMVAALQDDLDPTDLNPPSTFSLPHFDDDKNSSDSDSSVHASPNARNALNSSAYKAESNPKNSSSYNKTESPPKSSSSYKAESNRKTSSSSSKKDIFVSGVEEESSFYKVESNNLDDWLNASPSDRVSNPAPLISSVLDAPDGLDDPLDADSTKEDFTEIVSDPLGDFLPTSEQNQFDSFGLLPSESAPPPAKVYLSSTTTSRSQSPAEAHKKKHKKKDKKKSDEEKESKRHKKKTKDKTKDRGEEKKKKKRKEKEKSDYDKFFEESPQKSFDEAYEAI